MNKQLVLWAFAFGFVGGAIVTYVVSDQGHLLPKDKAKTKRMIVELRRRISDELETME
jgi:poly(3-hydroxybutyrate) depolymerase